MIRIALTLALLAVISLLHTANGSPILRDQDLACERQLNASSKPNYDWSSKEALELATCLQRVVPKADKCVFYTAGNRDRAILYADEKHKITIYDVYSPSSFNTSRFPAAEWVKSGNLRKAFQVTSRAYAIACSGQATLVIEQDAKPCKDSIWITDEFDAIKKKLSKITSVWQASPFRTAEGVWAWIETKMTWLGQTSSGKAAVEKRGFSESVQEQITLSLDSLMQQKSELQDQVHEKLSDALKFGVGDIWALETACSR